MKSILKKIIIAIITWEARLVLKKYKPQIVAVTGSVGKTSAKLNGLVVINNSTIQNYSFEWGQTANLGNATDVRNQTFTSTAVISGNGTPLMVMGCGWLSIGRRAIRSGRSG